MRLTRHPFLSTFLTIGALAGFAADRFPKRGFALAIGGVMLAILVLALWSSNSAVVVIAFVVWGAAFGGVLDPLRRHLPMRFVDRVLPSSAGAGSTSSTTERPPSPARGSA